eukprot:2306241-Prymnesium_polylepis.3
MLASSITQLSQQLLHVSSSTKLMGIPAEIHIESGEHVLNATEGIFDNKTVASEVSSAASKPAVNRCPQPSR